MHAALEPWQPTSSDPWDVDAASHLWRRAGFGAEEDELDHEGPLVTKQLGFYAKMLITQVRSIA